MTVSYEKIKPLAALYLSLPLLLFFGGFLRLPLAAAGCAATAFGAWRMGRPRPSAGEQTVRLGRWMLPAVALAMLAWTWLGGLNGLCYQSDDWPWRNAIFHDLIRCDWPVTYPATDRALVYYIGFWLPPALLAKLAGWAAGSAKAAWWVGQLALWVWAALGLTLICLLLFAYQRAAARRQQLAVLLLFVFFSGMDLLGAAANQKLGYLLSPDVMHLEWWTASGKQYSSLTTCVYWVFNQAIIPWLATLCFLFERDAGNYLFLGLACFACGPLPFVGLVVLMLARWAARLVRAVRAGAVRGLLGSTFTAQNWLLAVLGFPVLISYYLCNLALAGTARQAGGFWQRAAGLLNGEFLLFLLLDCGVYLLLTWRRSRREPLFYAAALSLLVIPFFKLGTSEDFCMRASIPAVFLLMLFCGRELLARPDGGKTQTKGAALRRAALACALLLGAATPLVEMGRGVYHAVAERSLLLAKDGIRSVDNLSTASAGNFTADAYASRLFFACLARPAPARPYLRCGEGVYDVEGVNGETKYGTFRWCGRQAELLLYNDTEETVETTWTACFGVMDDLSLPLEITVECQGERYTFPITQKGQWVTLPLQLEPGETTLTLTSNRTQIEAPEDPRTLYFSISGAELLG